jgi:senataxin
MMSDKRNEIIKRQRRIADLIYKKNQLEKGKAKELTLRTNSSSGDAKKPLKSSSATQKRPSRTNLKRPSGSASSVLAAARAKASGQETETENGSTSTLRSQKLKRKTFKSSSESNKSGTSRLASLVQNVSKATLENGASDSLAVNYSPEDFWRNIRDWDFVGDLARQRQEKPSEANAAQAQKKPIPDTFINTRHYVAVWAPRCLAETRAQILSEVATEYSNMISYGQSPFVMVNVETTWKSARKDRGMYMNLMDMDSCNVQLKTIERNQFQFYCHDICALIPVEHKDVIEVLLRGGPIKKFENSFSKFAMIGHTESNRRGLNDLILKVSKRKWTILGAKKMFLLKVGCNITALREFTALCKTETIPLKKYLLCCHLEKTNNRPSSDHARGLSNQKEKSALLRAMGGVQALGLGFTEFVKKKFNPSQLMAISAASRGYGDGGFTLIKGPPGKFLIS